MLATGRGSTGWNSTGGRCSIHGRGSTFRSRCWRPGGARPAGVARSMAGARHSDLDAGERKGLDLQRLDLMGLDRRELLDPREGLDIQISMLANGRGSTWWNSTGGRCSIHGRGSIHGRDSAFRSRCWRPSGARPAGGDEISAANVVRTALPTHARVVRFSYRGGWD